MHRIAILYGQPTEPAEFDRHYFDTHVPIVESLPGLRQFAWSKPRPLGEGVDVYFVAELWFDTAEDLKTALRSPEMAAAGADLQNFSVTSIRMFSGEVNVVAGTAV